MNTIHEPYLVVVIISRGIAKFWWAKTGRRRERRYHALATFNKMNERFINRHRWITAQNDANITLWACIHNTIIWCKHKKPLSLTRGGVPELVCAVRPFECAGAGLTRALSAMNRAIPLQRRARAPTVATAWAQQNSLFCSTHFGSFILDRTAKQQRWNQ